MNKILQLSNNLNNPGYYPTPTLLYYVRTDGGRLISDEVLSLNGERDIDKG
jgi:hypothetical protein